ncbi:1,25-dihydroxyvitamin D(3) 24-hydroxylase, mitochondrial-like [Ptychodera flava]|uniref:1,25-dihydroxyvitamin D(3) 24-hydroxylase, mitochondrial-like n=1 Tax=Ptychodera flava TaxID=63121 RepID=UPI003969E743
MAIRSAALRYLGRRNSGVSSCVQLRSTATNSPNAESGVDTENTKSFDQMPGITKGAFQTILFLVDGFVRGTIQKPWASLTKMRKDLGPIWKQRFGKLVMVSVADPQQFETVLRNEGKYPRRNPLEPWIAHRRERNLALGVLLHEGADWHRNRAALSKRMMRPREVASYTDAVNDVITDLTKKVIRARDGHKTDNIVPDIENILFTWSLDSACAVILNKKLNLLDDKPHPEAQAFIKAVHDMFDSTMWMFLIPTQVHKKFNSWVWKKHVKAWDTIYATAKTLIDEKMNDVTERVAAGEDNDTEEADFVTYMVVQGKLEIAEIYANVTELLAAAVDTTSSTFLWTLHCVSKYPQVQESLYEEIKRVIPAGETPTHEHINGMPYLKAILKETMRLHPPVINVSRIIDREVTVGGYRVPAETILMGQTWLMGRDPEYFEDPLEFQPERWIRDEKEHFYGFKSLPFGYGPRMCIGKRLAELEIHLALARLCQRFILVSTTDVEGKITSITAPDRPLNLKFLDRTL